MLNEELLTITATSHYGAKWKDKVIQVTKMPESSTVDYFQSNLSIRQEEDESSILNISIRDTSPLRDPLTSSTLLLPSTMRRQYATKNLVAIILHDFINDRLIIIENELGDVESDLEVQENNQIVDLDLQLTRS